MIVSSRQRLVLERPDWVHVSLINARNEGGDPALLSSRSGAGPNTKGSLGSKVDVDPECAYRRGGARLLSGRQVGSRAGSLHMYKIAGILLYCQKKESTLAPALSSFITSSWINRLKTKEEA